MRRRKIRFGICKCGRRRSASATMCRECWQEGASPGRALSCPERAAEMMAESFAFPISRLDLISFRRLLKKAAESIFDAYSIDFGNGLQFSRTAPHGARFDFEQLNRAIAKIDAIIAPNGTKVSSQ
jgi:hypothetical protein